MTNTCFLTFTMDWMDGLLKMILLNRYVKNCSTILYLSNLHSKNQSCFIFYGEQKCNEIYNLRTTHVPPIIKVTCFNVSLQLRQFFIIYVRRRY